MKSNGVCLVYFILAASESQPLICLRATKFVRGRWTYCCWHTSPSCNSTTNLSTPRGKHSIKSWWRHSNHSRHTSTLQMVWLRMFGHTACKESQQSSDCEGIMLCISKGQDNIHCSHCAENAWFHCWQSLYMCSWEGTGMQPHSYSAVWRLEAKRQYYITFTRQNSDRQATAVTCSTQMWHFSNMIFWHFIS